MSTKTFLKTGLLTTSFSCICGLAGWLCSKGLSPPDAQGLNAGLFVFGVTFALAPLLVFPLVRKTHLLVQAHNDLEVLARTDTLTGVPNRRHFYETAEAILQASPEGQIVAAVMIDVDKFKVLNDTHGHATGDAVLKAVAGCLSEQFREIGSDDGAFGRIGGEEFAVLLAGDSALEATRIAQSLVSAVRALRFDRYGLEFAVTVSAGTSVQVVPCTLDTIICRADTALYAAKSAGRNRVIAVEQDVAGAEADRRPAA